MAVSVHVCTVRGSVSVCDLVLANEIGKVLNKRERTLFEDGAMGERNKTGESEISALYEPLETVGHLNVIFTITSIKA